MSVKMSMQTSMGSTFMKVAKVVSGAAFALVMTTGLVPAAHAAPAVPEECSNVGGGTWCRGSGMSGILKGCYSNYVHPDNYHSSTASIGDYVDKRYASAGSWSRAYAEAGVSFTCYTYYNPNA
jgi:hypothetical protein